MSLLIPQDLARHLLPAGAYKTLVEYSRCGVPTDCGPDWSRAAVEAAKAAGPHVSALLPENVTLMWEDIEYQVKAGFVTLVTETELFADEGPPNLKISRVAVVPQVNRRGRIILNLSADVRSGPPNKRRRPNRLKKPDCPAPPLQVSVNATTVPAADQEAVLGLGRALPSLLRFMFDVPPDWEVEWQKVDLSDGFWRMIVQRGTEHNFVFQMPPPHRGRGGPLRGPRVPTDGLEKQPPVLLHGHRNYEATNTATPGTHDYDRGDRGPPSGRALATARN